MKQDPEREKSHKTRDRFARIDRTHQHGSLLHYLYRDLFKGKQEMDVNKQVGNHSFIIPSPNEMMNWIGFGVISIVSIYSFVGELVKVD